jgi:YHS domain-containing protein
MINTNTLASRIDAEFSAAEQKVKQFQAEQVQEHEQRQKRLEQLGKVFDQMQEVWRPRLELLVKKFGDRVQVKPRVVPSTREATFDFKSRAANVRLKFSACTDRDVRKLVISYDLEIIPVLMRFNPHAEVEFPLDAVDRDAVAKWVDDRIVEFVQTYFSISENATYMKDEMVEDPIAHVRFPKYAAAATLEWRGHKFYFIGEETRQEFVKQQGITNADQEARAEGPGKGAAQRAAEWSAQELAKMDEGQRHVDEAIHGADRTKKKVYPKPPEGI